MHGVRARMRVCSGMCIVSISPSPAGKALGQLRSFLQGLPLVAVLGFYCLANLVPILCVRGRASGLSAACLPA